MKIAFICGFAWEPKGTVRSRAFPLAVELSKRGHEVTIFITPYDNRLYSGQRFVRDGVSIVNLDVPSSFALQLARLPFQLVGAVVAWSPDLIHVFKPKGLAGIAASLLLRKRDLQLVLDCDDWEGRGGWNELSDHSWFTKAFIDWQERSLICRTAVVTVASRVLAERALAFGKNSEQVFYVPNGVNEDQLWSAEALKSKDPGELRVELGLRGVPVILYVGHFDPADDVLFFCKGVVAAAAGSRWTVAIVGDGPELPLAKSFFSNHPNLEVKYFGRLSAPEYARVVAAADIAAFPYPDNSVYRAKCSARIIDYMTFGKAIISSAVGENREYIVNGESGILVEPGDVDSFAYALRLLANNAGLRNRLGKAANERIREHYLWSGRPLETCLQSYECHKSQANGSQHKQAADQPYIPGASPR